MVENRNCWLVGGFCEQGQSGGIKNTDLSVCGECPIAKKSGLYLETRIVTSSSVFLFIVNEGKILAGNYRINGIPTRISSDGE